ncbi:ABC transporter ATP-binding protein [uncultured Roseovarius sp.]|uniref:ABC transporter ATP-binding protein n=1 Tax=uncultured Roseovarius sp. TaxID=293344 RepID=UPI0026268C84|nr:oligopeptide/dipeptide ABC transporter ATP-binding protein [uncultured Roseovarius sp.]
MTDPILKVRDLSKVFQIRSKTSLFGTQPLHAVSNVSFDLHSGEVLGIVGESGCGKSTLGRLVLRLIEPASGEITLMGRDLRALSKPDLRAARTYMQMVFQDPNGSLNPAMSIGNSIADTLRFHGVTSEQERRARAEEVLTTVGLEPVHYDRLPHHMSGGQNQRVGIARALIANPKLVVMDEAVSALDVSVQAQILKLIEDIQRELKIGIIFISHDLSVVHRIADRVVVLYMGRVMETAPVEAMFAAPKHPYTQGLLASRPSIEPGETAATDEALSGDLPSPLDLPSGCPFVSRCKSATDVCRRDMPVLRTVGENWQLACHNAD